MTLAKFKNNLKIVLVIISLSVYGAGAYLLGKSQNVKELIRVKGTSSQNQPNSPIESPVPFADTQSHTITPSYVRLCSNTTSGFELAYPKDWFTTYNREEEKCLFFAPYSFVLPQDTEGFQIPIKIEVVTIEDWPTVTKFYENPNDFVNIISTENVQLGNYPAKKITAQSSGGGQQERGLAKVTYLIFASAKPMVLTHTQLTRDDNFQQGVQVLEEMIKSLKFF